MKRSDRPALDTGDKDMVGKFLVLLNKVLWRLLCGNRNEWDALVCWFEPDYLRLVLLTVLLMAAPWSVTGLTLSLLLLFGGLTAWSQEAESSKKISINTGKYGLRDTDPENIWPGTRSITATT